MLTDFSYSITIIFIYIESTKYNTYIRQGSLGKVIYIYIYIYILRHRLAFVTGRGSHYGTVHIIRVYYNIILSGSWEGYKRPVHTNSIRILVRTRYSSAVGIHHYYYCWSAWTRAAEAFKYIYGILISRTSEYCNRCLYILYTIYIYIYNYLLLYLWYIA